MKRSDALDIIDGVLLEHELPLLQGISKEILGKLERAGMLPPFNLSLRGIDDSLSELEYHDWEPEETPKPLKRKVQIIATEGNFSIVHDFELTNEQIDKFNYFIEYELEE